MKNSALLLWIIVLAVILRLALILGVQGHLERADVRDTATYTEPALKLLKGEGFISDGFRTPVYPLFIAFFYWLFGKQSLPIILAQIFLSIATIYMTYLLGKKLLTNPIALIAALLLAISVESITHSFFLLTETLFTALFLGSILTYVLGISSKKRIWILCSGLLMGLSILCRPIAAYFPFIFLFLIIFDKAKGVSERILKTGIYLASVFMVVVPWILWNQSTIGIPTITLITDYNLLFYNAASLQANKSGVEIETVRDNLLEQVEQILRAENLPDTPANNTAIYHDLAMSIILSDPLRYSYLHLKNDMNNLLPGVTDISEILGITTGGKGTLAILNQYGLSAAIRHYFEDKTWLLWVFAPAIILLLLIYLTNFIGIGVLIIDNKWYPLALILLPLLYLILIPGAASNQRFRVPAMPFFCLLAAQGSVFVWDISTSFLKRLGIIPAVNQKI